MATRKIPAGGVMSWSAAGMLRAGSKPAWKRRPELADVGLQAGPGGRVRRMAHGDLDRRRDQEPLDLSHRPGQAIPLGRAERAEDRCGRLVRPPVEFGPLGQPAAGEAGRAHPAVRPAAVHDGQPVRLQRPEQPAQVARVQVEPGTQRPDVGAVRADLPQQAGVPERAVPGQELVVERAGPGDGPVEPPDLADQGSVHSLTVVREIAWGQRGWPAVPGSPAHGQPGTFGRRARPFFPARAPPFLNRWTRDLRNGWPS